MVLDWLAKSKAPGLPELLAKKQFARAVELAQGQLKARPRDGRLRLQLADTLIAAGRGREAVPLLREMADELAADGFAAKAIAILKRIQKIDPGRLDVEKRLASVIAERARRDAAAAPPPSSAVAARPAFEFGMEEIEPEPELELEPPAAAAETDALPDFAPVVDDGAALELEAPAPASRAPRHALFPDFSDDELLAVMGGLRLVSFGPGELVVAQGEPGDSLFLVTSGQVKAWIRDGEGRYVLARRLGEGDFFGEISVLSGSPRTATVIAASACELLELDRATLDGITAAHPRVRDVLQRFYDQRVANRPQAAPPGGR